MRHKERLRFELQSARWFTEHLLERFATTGQWLHQLDPRAYHALWCAGHIALVENFAIQVLDPRRALEKPRFREKFAVGTCPTSDPADYPSPEEVLAYLRERRATLHELLDPLEDEDLGKPAPPGSPRFVPDLGSIFHIAAWHEAMHSGQVNTLHRALEVVPPGHRPVPWTGPTPIRAMDRRSTPAEEAGHALEQELRGPGQAHEERPRISPGA